MVFWAADDTRLERIQIESLSAKVVTSHKIIDAWGALLNHNEKYRNRDSPEDISSTLKCCVGHTVGRILDGVGQERLEMDWQNTKKLSRL
ncbi:hypothetical protein L6452_08801 [Arctium lappa]|uniref:Uncharacterized protein n=1 Tax=Arctium lappa TaxID=4217 RepID=A0ACB9DIL6_ARCLA|nr:hypothetical protein L6452_08801 [Arctium lappa]